MRPSHSPASPIISPLRETLNLSLLEKLTDRAHRDQLGLFLAEGLRSAHATIEHQHPISGLAVCRDLLHSSEGRALSKKLTALGCPTIFIKHSSFEGLSRVAEPQGILLVLEQRWLRFPIQIGRSDFWIAAERVRTPGNLGTLIRSSYAAGARGLIIVGPPRDRADPFDPAVVRASMGSLLGMQIVSTHHQELRRWPCRHAVRIIGADGNDGVDYRRIDFKKPTILMLGEERAGLSEAQKKSCDGFARIPMRKGVDSLNLAMAGTLLAYEVARSRTLRR